MSATSKTTEFQAGKKHSLKDLETVTKNGWLYYIYLYI